MFVVMEVCVDSIQSALNAYEGGASRIELCSSLDVGGLTPSLGMLKMIKRLISIPVHVLIRPRRGDFVYSKEEIEVMCLDLKLMIKHGADGVVLGALNSDGTIDCDALARCLMIPKATGCSLTFHRAFDLARDPFKALTSIENLGFNGLLSSGQAVNAFEGRALLRLLSKSSSLIIVPGGGITEENLAQLLQETGFREFHASASHVVKSVMNFQNHDLSLGVQASSVANEYSIRICSVERVKKMVHILNSFNNQK